jgi:hypothetical protein
VNRGGTPENLKPIQPGEVRNPTGRNQYSYRLDFERTMGRLLKGALTQEEIEALDLPAHILDLAEGDDLTRGELIALVVTWRAMKGDRDGMAEALARLWPKVERHEHTVADDESEAALLDRLASIARTRRANGHDSEPDAIGPGSPE